MDLASLLFVGFAAFSIFFGLVFSFRVNHPAPFFTGLMLGLFWWLVLPVMAFVMTAWAVSRLIPASKDRS